jgi:cytokinesis protein
LESTKTSDNKSTLVHFLVKTIQSKYRDVLSVGDELKHMAAAAKVSTQTLATEVDELKQGLEAIHRDMQSYSRLGAVDPEDRFAQYTTEFIVIARENMQSLLDLQKRMNVEYEKTVRYFGEDPAKTRSDEFFAVFYQFLGTFERALQHNISKEEQKAEREKREKERQEIVNRKQSLQARVIDQKNGLESAVSGQEELKLAVQRRQMDPSKLAELETNLKKHKTEGSGSENFQAVLQKKRQAMKTVRFSSDNDKGIAQDDERQEVSNLGTHTTNFCGVLGNRRKKVVSFADESNQHHRYSREVTTSYEGQDLDAESYL